MQSDGPGIGCENGTYRGELGQDGTTSSVRDGISHYIGSDVVHSAPEPRFGIPMVINGLGA